MTIPLVSWCVSENCSAEFQSADLKAQRCINCPGMGRAVMKAGVEALFCATTTCDFPCLDGGDWWSLLMVNPYTGASTN